MNINCERYDFLFHCELFVGLKPNLNFLLQKIKIFEPTGNQKVEQKRAIAEWTLNV